mgnify:FL=1
MRGGIAAALAIACLGMAVQAAETPEPSQENGIITADEWAEVFPEIVDSYKSNEENSYRISYIEEDPYIVNVYEGFGFAKDYTSAVGHSYCLEDVGKTERPHPLANCLTCKTADFTKLVNDMGVEAYKYDFEETYAKMNESVGCYSCHENQEAEGKLVVTHDYVSQCLGEGMNDIAPQVMACGQCHIEYYFDPETKQTLMPYGSVDEMTPESILAYYDELGFSDWTQESTGTGLLKAQHPEFETYMNGSVHAKMGVSCADCHMAQATAEDGSTYVSHKWESPLNSEALLETCAACHKDTDVTEKVKTIQAEVTAAEKATGEKLSALNDALTEAVAGGSYTEEQLNEIRSLYRSAQWFWDYCYVENSEGAHNSALAKSCLETADGYIEEAMALFTA